jgi:hypothetical protein|tara:strand:- start:4647 stop:4826 length:180 start_codon:yes stop_codon:yes gene_type:complete
MDVQPLPAKGNASVPKASNAEKCSCIFCIPAIHGNNRTFTLAFGTRHPEKVKDDFFRID